jgi:hypothetical protein
VGIATGAAGGEMLWSVCTGGTGGGGGGGIGSSGSVRLYSRAGIFRDPFLAKRSSRSSYSIFRICILIHEIEQCISHYKHTTTEKLARCKYHGIFTHE